MEYKGRISDNVTRKDKGRATLRSFLLYGVFLTGPIILGSKFVIAAAPISHRSIVISIVLFPLGWFVVMLACQAVVMKMFVQFMRLRVWDSILFDSFYGHDIVSCTAFTSYYGTLMALSIRSGVSTVVSTISLLGILVTIATFLSTLGALGLTRIIFAKVLLNGRSVKGFSLG